MNDASEDTDLITTRENLTIVNHLNKPKAC